MRERKISAKKIDEMRESVARETFIAMKSDAVVEGREAVGVGSAVDPQPAVGAAEIQTWRLRPEQLRCMDATMLRPRTVDSPMMVR